MAFPGPEASRTTDSATARRLPLSPLLLNPGLGENHFSVSIGEVAAYSTKIDLAPDTDSGFSQWERWCFTSRASCQLPQKRFMPNGRNIGVCPKISREKHPKADHLPNLPNLPHTHTYHALRCRTSWASRHDVSFGVQSSCHRNACSKGSRSWGLGSQFSQIRKSCFFEIKLWLNMIKLHFGGDKLRGHPIPPIPRSWPGASCFDFTAPSVRAKSNLALSLGSKLSTLNCFQVE